MTGFDGVVIGIVDDLNDREGLGRIRVTFPWMADGAKSYWARLARPMAGSDRGTFFMPERGDEALVAFEHGDPRSAYVIGFLWNGVDKPPLTGIDNNVRRIKTTKGHTIDFDDRNNQEAITIKSQGGHTVRLDDTSSTKGLKLQLSSPNQHTIEMTPTPNQITVQFHNGGSIVMTAQSVVIQHGHRITITQTGIDLT